MSALDRAIETASHEVAKDFIESRNDILLTAILNELQNLIALTN